MNEFLIEYKQVFVALHMLGVAFGLGGATITDFSFFRALKNRRIDESEENLMHGLHLIIWVGIILLVVSGIALYLPQASSLLQSAKFVAKMCAVLIVILNGVLLTLVISPKLGAFDFTFQDMSLQKLHRLSFSLGAVSATSWYSAFVFAFLPRNLDIPLWSLAAFYAGILLAAFIGGRVMYVLAKKIMGSTH
jgi:hypothetical protein